MEIFIGSDYRGFKLKRVLVDFLARSGHKVVDVGAYEYTEGDDYNDPAVCVAESVRSNRGSCGILICGSAHGMTMQANRFLGIRAAHCSAVESAKLAREHDDANVLCLSALAIDKDTAINVVKAFLATPFEKLERRIRRVNRLDEGRNYA